MLLAVEGGRFFSSSASGYSNGLNLLLLGHKKEEKERVTPWNEYHHLVDSDPHLQLAANNNNKLCVCGCACFGRPAAAGLETQPTHQHLPPKTSCDLENSPASDFVTNLTCLKSSFKRQGGAVNDQNAPRKVEWTDVIGGELVEIREFEPSEHSDSDDEFENSSGKTCSCRIM